MTGIERHWQEQADREHKADLARLTYLQAYLDMLPEADEARMLRQKLYPSGQYANALLSQNAWAMAQGNVGMAGLNGFGGLAAALLGSGLPQ